MNTNTMNTIKNTKNDSIKSLTQSSSGLWFSFLTLSVLVLGTGCEVQNAVALRDEVQTRALESFPLVKEGNDSAPARFVNSRVFLWREDQTPEQMSRVLGIANWMDEHDLIASKLNAEIAEMEEKLAPIDSALKKRNTELFAVKNNINKKNGEMTKLVKSLIALNQTLQEATDKRPPDNALLEKLRAELKTGEDKKIVFQQEIVQLAGEQNKIETDLSQMKRNPDLLQRETLSRTRAADESLGQSKTAEIARLVDWYESPPVSFFFSVGADGSIKEASIDRWVLENGGEALNFTTSPEEGQKPTIMNAKYTELGGVFEFDVLVYTDPEQTWIKDIFSFRLPRVKYDAADGRVYLSGKMTRTRFKPDGTSEVRDGIAKLVDRNN